MCSVHLLVYILKNMCLSFPILSTSLTEASLGLFGKICKGVALQVDLSQSLQV